MAREPYDDVTRIRQAGVDPAHAQRPSDETTLRGPSPPDETTLRGPPRPDETKMRPGAGYSTAAGHPRPTDFGADSPASPGLARQPAPIPFGHGYRLRGR